MGRPATPDGELIDKPENDGAYQAPNSTANKTQVGGTHYKTKAIQPWDFIAANDIGYFEGAAIKYLSRWKDKGGVNDLLKAKHYIEKLIELENKKEN